MNYVFELFATNFTFLIGIEVLENHFGLIYRNTILTQFLKSLNEFLFREQSIAIFIEEQESFTETSFELQLKYPLEVTHNVA